jgi:hypothetical protein
MASEYNLQNTNKEICNALGCNSISEKEISLNAGDKKITISVCNYCLKKFNGDDDNEVQ